MREEKKGAHTTDGTYVTSILHRSCVVLWIAQFKRGAFSWATSTPTRHRDCKSDTGRFETKEACSDIMFPIHITIFVRPRSKCPFSICLSGFRLLINARNLVFFSFLLLLEPLAFNWREGDWIIVFTVSRVSRIRFVVITRSFASSNYHRLLARSLDCYLINKYDKLHVIFISHSCNEHVEHDKLRRNYDREDTWHAWHKVKTLTNLCQCTAL